MKYLWTEDTGAGLHFWKLVNHFSLTMSLPLRVKEAIRACWMQY